MDLGRRQSQGWSIDSHIAQPSRTISLFRVTVHSDDSFFSTDCHVHNVAIRKTSGVNRKIDSEHRAMR